MGNFLNTDSIRTILTKIKNWVKSRIFKETIIITDDNYTDYITSVAPNFKKDDGTTYNGISKKTVDILDYDGNVYAKETFTVIDLAVLKFPIGTRNIIINTRTVNIHRLILVPEVLSSDCYGNGTTQASVDKWKKFNGYKINIGRFVPDKKNFSNGATFCNYNDDYYNYKIFIENNKEYSTDNIYSRIISILYDSSNSSVNGLGGLQNPPDDFTISRSVYTQYVNSKKFTVFTVDDVTIENKTYRHKRTVQATALREFSEIAESSNKMSNEIDWGKEDHPINNGYYEDSAVNKLCGCKILNDCYKFTELFLINGKWNYFC